MKVRKNLIPAEEHNKYKAKHRRLIERKKRRRRGWTCEVTNRLEILEPYQETEEKKRGH